MLKDCVQSEICVFRRGNYYTHVMNEEMNEE